jgi:geranylgeranyl reductase family protein
MTRSDFDVIVAGAGVAGAAAAYFLTQAGLRVLVVDKARLPRYKACGGAIPRPALDCFPFSFDGVIHAAPTGVRFTYPGLPPVDVPLPDQPVVMVVRSEFDAFLLARSRAEVLEGVAVTGVVETDAQVRVELGERTVSARYLVGADGATSQVARSLGLRRTRRLGGTIEAVVPLDGNDALLAEYANRAVFALRPIPWGYVWVFPKGDHLSVGIGRFRPGRANLRPALQHEMDPLGICLDGIKLHGHPIPCYQASLWPLWSAGARHITGSQPQEKLSTRRCLLVGDAAGLVDPLVGEGIRYAIASAHLASEAIARDDLAGYEGAVWQDIGHSLATAGLTAGLFYRWPWLCFQLGLRNPATVLHLVDVLTEKASYQGIGRRLLAAMFRWFLDR